MGALTAPGLTARAVTAPNGITVTYGNGIKAFATSAVVVDSSIAGDPCVLFVDKAPFDTSLVNVTLVQLPDQPQLGGNQTITAGLGDLVNEGAYDANDISNFVRNTSAVDNSSAALGLFTNSGLIQITAQHRSAGDIDNLFAIGGAVAGTARMLYSGGRYCMPNPTSAATFAAQALTASYGGSGAPAAAGGINGDFYFRSDGGLLTTIYHKRAGAWVGIV